MIIEGTIFGDGRVLPGATVRVANNAGAFTGLNVIANGNGSFYLSGPDIKKGNYLVVTNVGYMPLSYALNDYNDEVELIMDIDAKEIDPVIVTGKYKNNFLIMAALLAASKVSQGKTVGATSVGPVKVGPKLETFVMIGAAGFILLNFDTFKKLLEGIGFWKSKEAKEAEAEGADPESPWSPAFYKKAPTGTLLMTTAGADTFITELKKCFGLFDDDEAKAVGLFKQLKTQSQLSFLADRFAQTNNADLLRWLWKDGWPSDRLSAGELAEITNYINKLPKYRP